MKKQHIYTVSELTRSIRNLLEDHFSFLTVRGEISNLRKPYSGHLYFTLKDNRGQLKAVLFKMQQRYLEQLPANGQSVLCRGRISVYEPRGDYQLIVDHIDFHGEGGLQLAVEELKKKLATEGLFAEQHKKQLPKIPEHITLITSPQGAAVHDFIKIASRRFPQIQLAIYPVTVQGTQAAENIAQGIRQINNLLQTDIIVLCRGGGSREDLHPFNDEQLARTIFASRIPVVNAVGHETDFTIADFASDLRAPTPSAAAELLLPEARILRQKIQSRQNHFTRLLHDLMERLEDKLALQQYKLGDFSNRLNQRYQQLDQESMRLAHNMEAWINHQQGQLNAAQLRLERQNPSTKLQLARGRLSTQHDKLLRSGLQKISSCQQRLERQKNLLEAMSPHATLARGYAIIRKKKSAEVIMNSEEIKVGDQAEVLLHQGQLEVTVNKTIEEGKRTERTSSNGGKSGPTPAHS